MQRNNSLYQEDISRNDLKGLFWRAPSYALLMILGLLSLAGIPLTMGFIGKFYILTQATVAHAWWLIATLIIGSGIALGYYLPLIFNMFEDTSKASDKTKVTLGRNIDNLLVYSFILLGLALGILPDMINQFIG